MAIVTLIVTMVAAVVAAAPAASAAPPPTRRAPACPAGLPLLGYGDSGPAVTRLQQRLGITPSRGFFGPRTRAAVRRLQADAGLVRDGVVGPRTWRTLGCDGRARSATGRPTGAGSRARIPAAVLALDWAALARCESRGNPGAVNPRGFYGLYRFSLSTWRATGGSGFPHSAPAAEQTYRAQLLFVRAGAGQWPRCGSRLFD